MSAKADRARLANMSDEIHISPEDLERISKAVENFGSKMQALVNIAKRHEGIITFFESPVWGNIQKIIGTYKICLIF